MNFGGNEQSEITVLDRYFVKIFEMGVRIKYMIFQI